MDAHTPLLQQVCMIRSGTPLLLYSYNFTRLWQTTEISCTFCDYKILNNLIIYNTVANDIWAVTNFSESGKVYTFGSNSDGQLGTAGGSDTSVPQQVKKLGPANYKMLGAGVYHSMALTGNQVKFSQG